MLALHARLHKSDANALTGPKPHSLLRSWR